MKQLTARADFETARLQAFLRDAGSVLRGDTRPLLSFDEVRRAARLEGQTDRGLKDVPIADIRGSVGRPNDFDASFLPVRPQMRKRWAQLDAAMQRGEAVPPIEVYHLGDVYFVKDGHHRVSVARHLGWKTMPARVIEVRTRAPLTGDMDAAALLHAREYVDFLERTQLDRGAPAGLNCGQPAGTLRPNLRRHSRASLLPESATVSRSRYGRRRCQPVRQRLQADRRPDPRVRHSGALPWKDGSGPLPVDHRTMARAETQKPTGPAEAIADILFETEGAGAPPPSPQVLAVVQRWLGPPRRVIELPARLVPRGTAPRAEPDKEPA